MPASFRLPRVSKAMSTPDSPRSNRVSNLLRDGAEHHASLRHHLNAPEYRLLQPVSGDCKVGAIEGGYLIGTEDGLGDEEIGSCLGLAVGQLGLIFYTLAEVDGSSDAKVGGLD